MINWEHRIESDGGKKLKIKAKWLHKGIWKEPVSGAGLSIRDPCQFPSLACLARERCLKHSTTNFAATN
jgi:hypothetical protein